MTEAIVIEIQATEKWNYNVFPLRMFFIYFMFMGLSHVFNFFFFDR